MIHRAVPLIFLSGCVATGMIGEPTPERERDPELGVPPPPPEKVCGEAPIGRPLLRRLSRGEYDRTLTDLLGTPVARAAGFATDTIADTFDNDAEALTVTPLLADQLRTAAEELAAEVAATLPCTVDACMPDFISSFGARAFRRPLEVIEHQRYLSFYRSIAAADGVLEAKKWVITAMLQSPNFLYRTELGLTQHELASALSYLITGTMPDQALFDAANAGRLATPAELEAEARRLLATPNAKANVHRFTFAWLQIDNLEIVPKDTAIFPELTGEVRRAMRGEVERFLDSATSFDALMTAPLPAPDATLAAFHGAAARARSGLLQLGAVLTTHARPNSTSPVHRGKLVREQLLCQKLAPPPPGVVVMPPELDPTLSARDRYSAHMSVEQCAGCHVLMDPIGFGFERFDGVGRARDFEDGRAIDASGEILGSRSTNATFEGVGELQQLLAASREAQDCFARQWFRFGFGLRDTPEMECAIAELAGEFRGGGLELDALLIALTRARHFTERTRLEGMTIADDTPEPIFEPPAPMPGDSTLIVEAITDSDWGAGYCQHVDVTNRDPAAIEWTATLDIAGTISSLWNAVGSGDRGRITFSGVEWNRRLEPGGSASFGFCANR